ncbi:ATP-binding protein [bacterium]|nr:ATP-binding protein [bacterium]
MDKEIIKQLIVENQEYIQNIEFTKRDYFFEQEGNYVLIGPRRAGKTYCMYQRIAELLATGVDIKSVLYINFEDERLLELKISDLDLIVESFKELFGVLPIYFLDEIQNIEGWEKFARRLADKNNRVFITGSNANMLSREIATTLGGRFIIKEIYPFTFQEFLHANGLFPEDNWEYGSQRFEIRKQFETYFYYGGFPEIQKFQDKRNWIDNLYQKIFYGDIISRYKIRNDYALKLMIKKLAESTHDEISFNRIKNIIQSSGTKIGTATIIEYAGFLEESWLIFGIKNYLSKISERESIRKYYFIDNGILSLFLYRPETILLENIVACKLKQLYKDQVYYVKDKTEVDFYIPTTKTLIQVAYSLGSDETEKREINSLVKAAELVETEKLLIITLDDQRSIINGNHKIEIVSVWKWLLLTN